MKKFGVIFQFELMNYIKNKSYMVTTIIVAVLAGIIMFVPSFFDLGGLFAGNSSSDRSDSEQTADDTGSGEESDSIVLIYDKSGAVTDVSFIQSFYTDDKIEMADSEKELIEQVESDKAAAGFVINSLSDFDYYVFNQSMLDSKQTTFSQAMTVLNQMVYCQENGIDYAEISAAFSPHIECHENVLGKDMSSNYWYCYGLVIIIFMIIIMYGVMVATSVTQEKSNRTIEVLVTSADTNMLFFAKVLAGALAALFQTGIILGVILITYKINQSAWGGMLDMILDIPGNVLVTFAFFGLGGFLFYTFIYGAMGALVSKTEDINKSAGGIQMVIMIVYIITLVSLMNVDGIVVKIASFLPISSYSAMFARVAMGTVSIWEIIVSFVILAVSTVGVGIIGAKIYRMGTLRYGNPIKLTNAIKSLKHSK